MQGAFSVERQLNAKTVFSVTYTQARSLHALRTRNINAPVCPTSAVCPALLTSSQVQALRPNPATGNIYLIESSGYSNSQLLTLNLRTTIKTKYTISGGYTLSNSKGDTDSLSSPRFSANTVGFPSYSYDTSNEYATSAFNARHSIFLVGSAQLPWGFRANTIIIGSTGRRFNITSGVDSNYDSLFFDRPTFSAVNDKCNQLGLTNSFCDISGISNPDTTIIPRNYGKGPGSFVVNLNLSKSFGFGGKKAATAGTQGGQGDGGNRGGGSGNRGGGAPQMVMMGGGGGGGMFGGGDGRNPYNLTFGINIQNLFNTVNLSSPVGSLTSPSFGRSRSTGGGFNFFGGGGGSANRRADLSVRFSW